MYVLSSTLLHLPPFRFYCVKWWCGWTQDCCDIGITWQSPVIRSNHSARSHPQSAGYHPQSCLDLIFQIEIVRQLLSRAMQIHLDKANNPSMSPFQSKKYISNTAEREGGCALVSPHLDSCHTVINFQLPLRPGLHSATSKARPKSVRVGFLVLVTSLWVQAVKKLPFCAMYRTLWWGYHPQSTVTILRHTVWS